MFRGLGASAFWGLNFFKIQGPEGLRAFIRMLRWLRVFQVCKDL